MLRKTALRRRIIGIVLSFVAAFSVIGLTLAVRPSSAATASRVGLGSPQRAALAAKISEPIAVIEEALEGAVHNALGDTAFGVRTPQCGTANGVQLIITGGDSSIKSCHSASVVALPGTYNSGVATITLRLTNNRFYAEDVLVPNGGSVSVTSRGSVAAQIGAVISRAADSPLGEQVALLPPGATATILLPDVEQPFTGVNVQTQFDGEAYLVTILQSAIDELALMEKVELSQVTKDLMKVLSGTEVLYGVESALTSTKLSLGTIRDLTDIGIDAVLAVLGELKVKSAGYVSVGKLLITWASLLWQSLSGLVDTLDGQASHTYSFGVYGPPWLQADPAPTPTPSTPSPMPST